MSLLLILLFSATSPADGNSQARPAVNTEYGAVVGRTVATLDGFRFDVFLGIPFARPPTGELRFEVDEATCVDAIGSIGWTNRR